MDVPVFDVDALRQMADVDLPVEDPERALSLWRSVRADLLAAADHIELQAVALEQRRVAA